MIVQYSPPHHTKYQTIPTKPYHIASPYLQLSITTISIHNATLLSCHFRKIATVSHFRLVSPRNLIIRIDTFCNINCQDDRSHTSISWRFAQLLTLSVTNHPLTGHFTSIWLVFLTCDWLAAFILEREIWKMTSHIGGCCCRKCQISLAGNKLFIKFQILSSKKIGWDICAHYGLVCIVNVLYEL